MLADNSCTPRVIVADAMIATGMKDAGYEYLVIDLQRTTDALTRKPKLI